MCVATRCRFQAQSARTICFQETIAKPLSHFKGCMERKIASAGRGSSELPFDELFWFNEIEKSLSGYVASRLRILSMRQYFPERDASARVAYKKSKAPTYDVNRVKLIEGTPEVLEVEAIDWRSAGDFPIENPFHVLMLRLES